MNFDTIGAVYAVVVLIVDIVIRVLAVIFVPQNRKPQTAAAWLLAIFLIPYLGIILFLLIGNTRLPKARRDKQREINEYILETTEGMDEVERDQNSRAGWTRLSSSIAPSDRCRWSAAIQPSSSPNTTSRSRR